MAEEPSGAGKPSRFIRSRAWFVAAAAALPLSTGLASAQDTKHPIAGAAPGHQLESASERAVFDLRNPDYAGSSGPSSTNRLLLKITERDRRGRPAHGEFQVKRFTFSCEGEGTETEGHSPFEVVFSSPREFRGFEYESQETGYTYFTAVRGQLSANGTKARDSVVVEDNPTSAPGGRYCFTGGWSRWDARAVR